MAATQKTRRAPPRSKLGTRGVPRAVREEEMVAVATRLFARREYEDVSMAEIARAAGVSKPMVYAYFESKQGLFLACVEHAIEVLIRGLEDATPRSLPPDLRLWHGLLAVFSFIEEAPDGWALLHPHGPRASGQLAAGAARAHDEMTGLLASLLFEAAASEGIDPTVAREGTEPLAHALVAAVQGAAAWWLANPGESKERQALRLMNFTWRGLENLLHGRLWLPPPEGGEAAPRTAPAERSAGIQDELALALRDDRDAFLDGAFRRMAESFDPRRAGALEAVVEWRIGGRPGGGHDRFQLHIGERECRVSREGGAEPSVVLTIEAADFLGLVTGAASGSRLFMVGKLKADGDLVLAARIPRMFDARSASDSNRGPV